MLGAALRLYRIGEAGFWRDEATAAFWSQMSVGELLAALRRDVHAPLYYILLGGWSKLAGTSEWGLRSLNALLGALCGVSMAWAARPLLGRGPALLAGLLVAVMPGFVLYSQQLSVSPLLILAAIGAIGATVRLLLPATQRPIPMIVVLALALAAMVYTHMWSALAWLGLGLAAVGIALPPMLRREWRRVPWPLLAAHATAVALWSPWLLAALGQARSRTMDHLPPTPSALMILLETTQYWYNESITALIVVGLLCAATGLLLTGGWRAEERVRRGIWLSLFSMFLMPHFASLIMAPQRDIYYARYALVCVPAGVLLLLAAARLVRGQRIAQAIPQPPAPRAEVAYGVQSAGAANRNGLRHARLIVATAIALLLIVLPWVRNAGFGTFFMASYLPSPLREVAHALTQEAGPRPNSKKRLRRERARTYSRSQYEEVLRWRRFPWRFGSVFWRIVMRG